MVVRCALSDSGQYYLPLLLAAGGLVIIFFLALFLLVHSVFHQYVVKSSRAVHRSRDCAGLEHDARVPLSEDLTTAKHGSTTLASKRASQTPQHRRPRGGLPKLSSKQRRQYSRQRDGYHVCRSGVKARKREQQ